jgi:hypothetical protein
MRFGQDGLSRRSFLGTTALAGAFFGISDLLQGCAGSHATTSTTVTVSHPNSDDYLNYLLCLEYLEAEYFLRASTGVGVATTLTGTSTGASVIGGSKVPFKTSLYSVAATQVGQQEVQHIQILRNSLFSYAVQEPAINFTAGFYEVGSGADLGSTFNPFADEQSFLLGAFFIEDILDNAYLSTEGQSLSPLAEIASTESYHSGLFRTLIYEAGGSLLSQANSIAQYRSTFNGPGLPITSGSSVYITAAGSGLSTANVLDTFYLSNTSTPGGFYPAGLNGFIR